MEENSDDSEVLETTEEEVEEVEEEEVEEDDELIALREKAAKVDELEAKNKKLYKRLKDEEEKEKQVVGGMSAKDFIALNDAKVTAEDFDEVQSFADWKNISITEALADKRLRTILKDNAEERRTAQATETKSPRGVAKSSNEEVLLKAERTGEVPTTDEGVRALAEARMARRKAKQS